MAEEPTTRITVESVPDPLADYHGKPLISQASPRCKYLGRIIVELWEQPGFSDAQSIALSVQGTESVGTAELLQRIAEALPIRAAKISLAQ